ncbi:MAG TPA: ABC transporter ATP-binding protein [Blastocatellia bacterium]|nr:ABC transporter ATP-binding protein [Blastocatellia bacterium]
MQDSPDVELVDVTKRFGSTVAVRSVSLAIHSGEFLTMLGPSGCGKTTVLRMIAGFEIPDEGVVRLGGIEVTNVPPYRRDVTTVFQQYALFPHLTVYKNVAFGLERRGLPRAEIGQRVGGALEMVRLEGFEHRRPSELSGGQQQRVALARSLVLKPRVLLLDEPLAALDLKLRKQMQLELKTMQRQIGISFVFVTHDQEEALTMSDRIVVMNGGCVEQMGTAVEIYERPATEFVAGFIGVSNILECEVIKSTTGMLVVAVGGATLELGAVDGYQQGDRFRLMVRPEKIALHAQPVDRALPARVQAAVYLGESTQLRAKLETGQEITVLEQNRDPLAGAEDRVGQQVWLRWEPGSAVVLR